MKNTVQVLIQNDFKNETDEFCFHGELRLAVLAEEIGFDGIWCVEHHFDAPYSMCPSNIQFLSYVAAKTERMTLTTGAVILPWHEQPMRIGEMLIMLDIMSNGRLELGFGRGLSRKEYAGFGIDMNDSRERFDEAYQIIKGILRDGVAEFDGKFFQQPRIEIHPAPARDLLASTSFIAMSPDSLEQAAEQGVQMATFVQFPIEQHMPLWLTYRETFEKIHGRPAPPPTLTEFVYCHEDSETAERIAREAITRYYYSICGHYEFGGDHFKDTKGYQTYHQAAQLIQQAGMEETARMYVEAQTWGTPDEIVEKIHARREVVGDYHLNGVFSYAGMPFEQAEASMRLYADKVIPAVSHIGSREAATA